ncbi:MAG: type II toxin-antitoxin system RelE/ParE family toxin [Bryobacteraceae bacterium]
MAFRVEITAAARIEADEILNWLIAQHAGDSGLRWFRAFYDAIDSLSVLPRRCSIAPENDLFSEEIRQLLYGRKPHRYRILFTIEGGTVLIMHIRHS